MDVTNHNDQTWFDVVGSFHSDAMRVTERFTFVDANTIDYQAVITDPKVYTRPWTMALRFDRFTDYGSELFEEACFETNERTLDTMLTRPAAQLRRGRRSRRPPCSNGEITRGSCLRDRLESQARHASW